MNRNVSTQVSSQSFQFEQAATQPPFQQQPPLPVKAEPRLQSRHSVSSMVTGIRDRETGFLGWWYRLTCPAVSVEEAKSLEGKEKMRKTRLASLTLLVLCGFIILPMPVALITANIPLLAVFLITLLVYGIALVCNRKNNLVLAGILSILVLELGFVLFFVTIPGGLNVRELAVYDIFLEASLISVAFFRPRSVFIITAINIAIIVGSILLLPKAPDLIAFLHENAYEVFDRPITLQLFGAFIVYIWVNSAQQAILRADRAEEVADLERREIERQEQEIEQKKQIDYGIDQILGSLNRVANGETNVKVPLDQNNVLWQIGYSINNLLSRIQAFREERAELIRTKQTAAALTEALKYGRLPRLDRWTHTCLDELLIELRKVSDWQKSHISSSPSPNRDNVRDS